MTDPRPTPGWSWTPRNVASILALTIVIAAGVGWRIHTRRARMNPDLNVTDTTLTPVAGEKIDPNAASWPSLTRLPGIGPAKAKAIVAYRRHYATEGRNRPAFVIATDLTEVPDIGDSIADAIAPYLLFPQAHQLSESVLPASRAASAPADMLEN